MQPNDSVHPAPNNQRGNRWLIVVAIVLISVLGLVFVVANNADSPSDTLLVEDESVANDVPTITITDEGFEPEEILVSPNARVRWVNQTSEPVQIASAPFPENDAHPELNASEPLGPGESFESGIGESGSYEYVDNFNPLANGLVTVFDEDAVLEE